MRRSAVFTRLVKPSVSVSIILTLTLLLLIAVARSGSRPPTASPTPTATAQVQENYGKVPLSFEANHGQVNKQVKYLTRANGHNLFLTPNEAVIELKHKETASTLRMKLHGAAPKPEVRGEWQLEGTTNYFLGNDPNQWRTNVPTYERVKYESVYPGVDVVYYGNQQQLEYDFVVKPGADPNAIKLSFSGAETLRLDGQGNLVIATAAGEVIQHKPIVYQESHGQRQEIAGNYVLQSHDKVSFAVGAYDASQTLVIDPVLSYATYATVAANGSEPRLAVDNNGSAYVVTSVDANPAIVGALNQGKGISVTKFSPDGTKVLYTAVIGGATWNQDRVNGLTVDSSGNLYLVGTTAAADFPTTPGAFRRQFLSATGSASGPNNSFVLKLNASGNALVFSTYFSSTLQLEAFAVGVDAAGNVIVTGATGGDLPATPNAYKPTIGLSDVGAPQDAFVTKFNPTGSALIYSTNLGGSSADSGSALAIDQAGNAYVMGTTYSSVENGGKFASIPFPTTSGAYEASSYQNIFLTKLDPNGNVVYSALPASGYVGGIAVDSAGNAYLSGTRKVIHVANDDPMPGTPGAFQVYPVYSDYDELTKNTGYVTKLSADGSTRVYSTYLGGPYEGSFIYGIAVDKAGCAYVTGESLYDFPATGSLFNVGKFGLHVAKLNASGSGLIYSTRILGSGHPYLGIDAAGTAYLTGLASPDFQPTPGAAIPQPSGDKYRSQSFLLKIAATTPAETVQSAPARVWDTWGIGGKVTDASGQGIDDVTFYVTATGISLDPNGFDEWFPQVWSLEPNGTFTRKQDSRLGYYEIHQTVKGGTYTITPYKPGYKFSPASRTISSLGSLVAASFTGTPTPETVAPPFVSTGNRYLAIRVLQSGSADVPAVGATVTLSGGQSEVGTTDSKGQYFFTNLPPNKDYTVTISAPGNATQSYTFSNLSNNQSYVFKFQPPPPRTAVNVSAASFTPKLAVEGIATAFGDALATTTVNATTLPLPTTLGGTRVRIKDATNRTTYAPLFFVSPTQVNYQIPKGVAPGLGAIVIESADGTVSTQTNVQIDGVAPSLFSANASGKGVAAAQVQRVKSDGTSTMEAVSYFDQLRGQIMAAPIDLSSVTDQNYLVLYGTGVRSRSQLSNVTAKIGGVAVQTTYAGSQNGYAGLDQINIMLPPALSGRGDVDVELSVDGKSANVVKVKIK